MGMGREKMKENFFKEPSPYPLPRVERVDKGKRI
jgi:hypothetical protein